MKATVSAIEAKSNYTDGIRRIVLRFEGTYAVVRLPENSLEIAGLKLDDEVEVSFHPVPVRAKSEAA